MEDNKDYFNPKDFIDDKSSGQLILASFKILMPDKRNFVENIICIGIGIILGCIIGKSSDTVTLSLKISDILLNVQTSVFTCIFAIYSILLAFLSDSYIKKLLSIDYGNGISYLAESTKYYGDILFVYFVGLITSLIMKIGLSCMPKDFILTKNDFVNDILAVMILSIYFSFSFRVIYELKSMIYNTVILFKTSLAYKIILLKKADNKLEEDKNDNADK